MSSKVTDVARVHLKDGSSGELAGCTVVYPAVQLALVIEVQRTDHLAHLVRWAHDQGYGCPSLSLTLRWSCEELEEQLGCRINGEFLDAAQEWLDTTGGGFAASVGLRFWEDVIGELEKQFKGSIALAEPLSNNDYGFVRLD